MGHALERGSVREPESELTLHLRQRLTISAYMADQLRLIHDGRFDYIPGSIAPQPGAPRERSRKRPVTTPLCRLATHPFRVKIVCEGEHKWYTRQSKAHSAKRT